VGELSQFIINVFLCFSFMFFHSNKTKWWYPRVSALQRIASQDSLLESMAEALNKTLQAVNDLKQTQENIYTQGPNFGIEGGIHRLND
jgi:hypothetical protein